MLKNIFRRIRPNRAGYILLSFFFATVLLIVIVWWPLAREQLALIDWHRPLWPQLDGLLLGLFVTMSLLIVIGADLKNDVLLAGVGFVGGLVIESWGTTTNLWHYYTNERPPLWIIPAWPIASLAIDRLYRLLRRLLPTADRHPDPAIVLYWIVFPAFYLIMLAFVRPYSSQPLTVAALILCAVIILTPIDCRAMLLIFIAGAGLGYFLELWGTTRACWTYYTDETPPLFAVLAHGMAAVTFWRVTKLAPTAAAIVKKIAPPGRDGTRSSGTW